MISDKELNEWKADAKSWSDFGSHDWMETSPLLKPNLRILSLISSLKEAKELIKQKDAFILKAKPGTIFIESNLYVRERIDILALTPKEIEE